jgi:hypothetical protein
MEQSSMSEVAERDSLRAPRWPKGIATKLVYICSALVFAVLAAYAIQVFGRYQYVVDNGVVWRIDRFTQHACRMVQGRANCGPPPRSISVSTSTSLSPSLSTSANAAHSHAVPKKT